MCLASMVIKRYKPYHTDYVTLLSSEPQLTNTHILYDSVYV